MTDKLAQAIGAARSREDLAAILDMLYSEMKNIYANGLSLRDLIDLAPMPGCRSEYTVCIVNIRLRVFRPYHHFDTLDAIRMLYEQYEKGDWHVRFHEIHARAFCDAVMSRIREYYPQIELVEPYGDPRSGFSNVRVRLATPT